MTLRTLLAFAAAALLLVAARPASACASCACGDPTLVAMGAEQPFAGRLRLAADLNTRREWMGAGAARLELEERRLDLSAAWSPLSWLTVSGTLPLVQRTLAYGNLARASAQAPGDLELRARAYVWRSRRFAPDHLLALHAGVQLPTAPTMRAGGRRLDDEVQPGSQSVDGLLGLSYLHLRGPLSYYGSAVLRLPGESRLGYTAGQALLGTAAVQLQPWHLFSIRLGIDGRLEEAARDEPAGTVRDDTGGLALFATPALLVQPGTDWLVQAQVRVPFFQRMRGQHEEGVGFSLGVVRDL